jgi:hypothetical protein
MALLAMGYSMLAAVAPGLLAFTALRRVAP